MDNQTETNLIMKNKVIVKSEYQVDLALLSLKIDKLEIFEKSLKNLFNLNQDQYIQPKLNFKIMKQVI